MGSMIRIRHLPPAGNTQQYSISLDIDEEYEEIADWLMTNVEYQNFFMMPWVSVLSSFRGEYLLQLDRKKHAALFVIFFSHYFANIPPTN